MGGVYQYRAVCRGYHTRWTRDLVVRDLERVRGIEMGGGSRSYLDTFDLVQPSDGETWENMMNRLKRVP